MPVAPTARESALLVRYLDELSTWTLRVNLTTVPREEAWARHVEETLDLVEACDWPVGSRCVDIGSGGGVPGIVVAVVRPDLALTLVESDRRKAGFLTHVCGLLGLAQVRVEARRVEQMARDPAHAGQYDVAVSRACAPPAALVSLAVPLLHRGGSLWAMVRDAPAAADEARAPAAAVDAHVTVVAPGILAVTRVLQQSR